MAISFFLSMGTVCTKNRPLFSSVQQCYGFVEEVNMDG